MKHGVSAIISRKNGKGDTEYLLIRANKERGEHTGKYYPPGGWIDEGETEQEAAVRECREELNLNVKVIRKIADLEGDIENLMLHFMECEIIDGQIKMDTNELNDVAWVSSKQFDQIRIYPATRKILDKLENEKRY